MRCKPGVIKIIALAFLVVPAAFVACWVVATNGSGASIASRNRLTETTSKTDIVATGNTYFSLERDSVEVYVRSGMLCVLRDGELALRTNDGDFPFTPRVMIPFDATSFEVDLEGNVRIKMDGEESLFDVGQIECNRFAVGRLLGRSLSNVVTSDAAPSKHSFGLKMHAIVLTGWRSEVARY